MVFWSLKPALRAFRGDHGRVRLQPDPRGDGERGDQGDLCLAVLLLLPGLPRQDRLREGPPGDVKESARAHTHILS